MNTAQSIPLLASSVLLVTAIAGCGRGGAGPRPTLTPTASNTGAVAGGIEPCEGIAIPGGPRFAAGTVTVLAGNTKLKRLRGGVYHVVLPKRVVARQTVSRNHTYHFRLAPGRYVLRARYAGSSNVHPFVKVKVTAGAFVQANVPNMCM